MIDYIEFVAVLPTKNHTRHEPQQQHDRLISKTWTTDTATTDAEGSTRQDHQHPEGTTTSTSSSSSTDNEDVWSDDNSSVSSVTLSFGTEHDIYTVLSSSSDNESSSFFAENQKRGICTIDPGTMADLQSSMSCPTFLNDDDEDESDDDDSFCLFGLRQQWSLPTTTDT